MTMPKKSRRRVASLLHTPAGTTGDTLRGMCDTVRDKAGKPAVAVLVGKAEDKVTMAVTVTKQAQEKGLKAGALVKEIATIAGGKGDTKPDFAMAGLKDETKIDEARLLSAPSSKALDTNKKTGSPSPSAPARCTPKFMVLPRALSLGAGRKAAQRGETFIKKYQEGVVSHGRLSVLYDRGEKSQASCEDEQVVAFYDINPQARYTFWWCPKSTLSLPLR